MNPRETYTALEFAREVREESLELLRALGRIGAPTGDEGRRAWFVATWLREQGATDVTVDEAHNVVCILGDRSEPGRAVFSAHTDVVFPDTGELPLTEDEENMYAPGIGDDTACLVTLLMATIQKPKLLLLDEHTAALDPKTAAKVLQLSDKIIAENQLTAMMVTHNMNDAITHGNRLIMMKDGKIILDIRGEEKKKLTVEDLLHKFEEVSGEEFSNDKAILG